MSGLTYDTGALLAAERNDRRLWAIHRRAIERSHFPTIPAGGLAQAWRGGPQPLLSKLLDMCGVENFEEGNARLAGALLARSKMSDGSRPVGWCNSSRVALRVRATMP